MKFKAKYQNIPRYWVLLFSEGLDSLSISGFGYLETRTSKIDPVCRCVGCDCAQQRHLLEMCACLFSENLMVQEKQ